jgi:hypothetical protein
MVRRPVQIAFIWSLGLLVAALVLPAYDQAQATPAGPTFDTVTLVHENGGWVLIPVAVPAILCAVVGLALRRRRRTIAWAAIGALAAFALLLIASIGAFIVPVVALLAWATAATPATGDQPSDSPVMPRQSSSNAS